MSVAPQATQICVPTGIGIIARTPPAHPPAVPRMPPRLLPARAGPGHCATPPRSPAQRRSPAVAPRYSPPQPQPAQSAPRHQLPPAERPCAPDAATNEPDWVNIVATRHLGNARLSRQALRDDPQLLARAPPPPSLRTSKHRNRRHMCPLTRQLMGKRSHAREPNGRRGWPDAYFARWTEFTIYVHILYTRRGHAQLSFA